MEFYYGIAQLFSWYCIGAFVFTVAYIICAEINKYHMNVDTWCPEARAILDECQKQHGVKK